MEDDLEFKPIEVLTIKTDADMERAKKLAAEGRLVYGARDAGPPTDHPHTSDWRHPFGYADFDVTRLDEAPTTKCPVRGCSATLVKLPYGKQQDRDGKYKERTKLWCPEHGIRLHSGTFVYWNGQGLEDEARLRNFIVRPDLVSAIALPKGMKAEAHRLGYEMSEDALSWNVFVSLAVAGKLRGAAQFLTGRSLRTEPHLYLWGRRIDDPDGQYSTYEPLRRARAALEADIHTFVTEPDIMLVADGEIVISIEAKFGSGNPLSHDGEAKEGEKPTSRAGLLARYLGERTSERTKHIVRPDHMGASLHSQLFRNIVFASEMAGEVPWHVVNLVSSTQRGTLNDVSHTFADPTNDVRGYLHPDCQHCFTYRTWEGLHAELIRNEPALAGLDRYLRGKSAHYLPAFELS